MAWFLAVFLAVLVVAYAFILFLLLFVVGLSQVESLRATAAFLLILSAVAFGLLLFASSDTLTAGSDTALEAEDMAIAPRVDAGLEDSAPACPDCGQTNPTEANFCYNCGRRLNLAEREPDDATKGTN